MTQRAAEVRLDWREERLADPILGWVPSSHFAIVADGTDVGVISLRHTDDEVVQRYAGHVGYHIEPEHRGRGYAATALRLLRPIAHAVGFDMLWITCSPDNIASFRTLEKAGATFVDTVDLPPESELYAHGERRKCRFRIETV